MDTPRSPLLRRAASLAVLAILVLGFVLVLLPASGESIGSWTANPNAAAAQGSQSCVLDSNIATIFCVVAGASSFVYYNTYSAGVVGATWTATTPITTGNANAYNWTCTSSGNLIYCISRNPSGAGSCVAYYATMTGTGVSSWTNTNAPAIYCTAVSYGENVNCGIYLGFEYCAGGGNPNLLLTVASVSGSGFGSWTQSTQAAGVNLQTCTVSTSTAAIYCVGGSPGAYSASTAYCPISGGAFGTCRSGGLFQATDYPFAVSDTFCFTQFNYLYCVGGTDSTPTYQTAVWYAPITTTSIGPWVTTNSYPTAARQIDCTIDAGGIVACFGGFNGGGINNSYYSAISQGVSTSTSTTTNNTLCTGACSGSNNGTGNYLVRNQLYLYSSQNVNSLSTIDNVTLKFGAIHMNVTQGILYISIYFTSGVPAAGNPYTQIVGPTGQFTVPIFNASSANTFVHLNPQTLICAGCYYAVGIMASPEGHSRGSGAANSGVQVLETSQAGVTEYTYAATGPSGHAQTPPLTFFTSTTFTPHHFIYIHLLFAVFTVVSSTTIISTAVSTTTLNQAGLSTNINAYMGLAIIATLFLVMAKVAGIAGAVFGAIVGVIISIMGGFLTGALADVSLIAIVVGGAAIIYLGRSPGGGV